MKRLNFYFSFLVVFVSFDSYALQCASGEVDVGGVCVSSCQILKGTTRTLSYEGYVWGDKPTSYCYGDRSTRSSCDMKAGPVSINVSGTTWSNTFTFTGSTCPFEDINHFSGDAPLVDDDINQNGVPDAQEDWDGDGIVNGEDPNPTQSDKADLDANDNGIPDKLEPFFERFEANAPDFVSCDSSLDSRCNSRDSMLRELAINNRELQDIVRYLAQSDANGDYTLSLENLAKTLSFQDIENRKSLERLESVVGERSASAKADILHAIDNIEIPTDDLGLTDVQQRELRESFEHSIYNRGVVDQLMQGQDIERRMMTGMHQEVISTVKDSESRIRRDIAAISSGSSSSVDLSGVESSISSLSDKIDGLETSDMSGVENKLDNLISSVTNDSVFSASSSGFSGDNFLFTSEQMRDIESEVSDLKDDISKQSEKFKKLFSVDTSSFNNGTFKEHTLDLRINGSEYSFKSGVFSALLDNASIISAVIMFLFVLSGIRMLGKD